MTINCFAISPKQPIHAADRIRREVQKERGAPEEW